MLVSWSITFIVISGEKGVGYSQQSEFPCSSNVNVINSWHNLIHEALGKCIVTPWQKGLHWGFEPCSIDHWVCRRCRVLHTSTRWNYKVVANQQVQGWLYWGTTDCIQTSLWPVQLLLEVYTHPIAISRGTLELPCVKQLSRMYWTQFFTHNGNQSQVNLAPNAILLVANNQCTAEPGF